MHAQRLASLDAFRGLTIAGMILVNNPGTWSHLYGPLGHATWHGWTPTDLVFPFFLFIVGTALPFSMGRRLEGEPRSAVLPAIARRAMLLFLLGMMLASTPDARFAAKVRSGDATAEPWLIALSLFRLNAPYILAIIGLALAMRTRPTRRSATSLPPEPRVDTGSEPTPRWGTGLRPVSLPHEAPSGADTRPETSTGIRTSGSELNPTPAPHSRWDPLTIIGLTLIAAAIGYFIYDYAYFASTHLRVPGVLQRIAICYAAAAVIVLYCGVGMQVFITAAMLAGYWAIVTWVHPPAGFEAKVVGPEGLLHEWIDGLVFGSHLYVERPDPEGLLSTLPAIATVLCGSLTGVWLRGGRERVWTLVGLFIAANVLLLAGLWWGLAFPLNKKIWTSSYVLATAGVGLHVLAMCYYFIDVRGWRAWAWPLMVFGSNAIVVYVASSVTARILGTPALSPGETSMKAMLFVPIQAAVPHPETASLLYALGYVAVWLVPMALLHRAKIFVKV